MNVLKICLEITKNFAHIKWLYENSLVLNATLKASKQPSSDHIKLCEKAERKNLQGLIKECAFNSVHGLYQQQKC